MQYFMRNLITGDYHPLTDKDRHADGEPEYLLLSMSLPELPAGAVLVAEFKWTPPAGQCTVTVESSN